MQHAATLNLCVQIIMAVVVVCVCACMVQWLVKRAMETRQEMGDYVRAYSISQFHKAHSMPQVAPQYQALACRGGHTYIYTLSCGIVAKQLVVMWLSAFQDEDFLQRRDKVAQAVLDVLVSGGGGSSTEDDDDWLPAHYACLPPTGSLQTAQEVQATEGRWRAPGRRVQSSLHPVGVRQVGECISECVHVMLHNLCVSLKLESL